MSLIINENLAADGSTAEANIVNPNTGASPFQVVYASGDFGSGTLTVKVSNDGGTVWFDATDASGSVTLASNGAVKLTLLGATTNILTEQIKIRCTLVNSTNPDLNISLADCR